MPRCHDLNGFLITWEPINDVNQGQRLPIEMRTPSIEDG
jgi:hypothetical protein